MAQQNDSPKGCLMFVGGILLVSLICWGIGSLFGASDNVGKSNDTNYKECSMCGDRVPEDDMRGKWCKDCQNDAFGEDGWYNKIKD